MNKRSLSRGFFALCLLGVALSAQAATKDKLRQIENQMDQRVQQQSDLDRKAEDTRDVLKVLRQNLVQATAAMQDKAEEAQELQEKLDKLIQDIADKKKALIDERQKLALVISALIELSRQPPETFFLQTTLTTDHIHRSILLRAVLPEIKGQAETMAHDLVMLNEMKSQMAQQKHLVAAAEENLHQQQMQLDQLIKTRQGMMQRTEAQKQAISKQLIALSSEAKDLRQLLEKVSPKTIPHPRASGTLSAVLRPPVTGTVIHTFGTRDVDDVMSEGLTYVALPGSPVVAPMAGRVVFAGPFRGYGKIVILQHDKGYHSFLAGFGRIDAEMGQEVDRGEPLGVLPAMAADKPELYFELRHNNEPIDPTSGGITLSKTP